MNQYVTGAVIKELREKNKLTQNELATKLSVSDKTISKWETGKGYPDISLLEPIANIFNISVIKLYPESKAETRLKSRGVKKIYCFCNRDGLFFVDVNKHIINTNGK